MDIRKDNSKKFYIYIDLPLSKLGDNSFQIYIFDSIGNSLHIEQSIIIITRTAVSIDAIPSSTSIAVEIKDKIDGKPMLDYLVKEGNQLPIKGRKIYKAGETLKAGTNNSLKFKLWEGEITDIPEDNRFIGTFEIKGSDFDTGVVPLGADLIVEYEMLDSGNIVLDVSIPAIGNSFNSGRNFYSRSAGQIDYSFAEKLIEKETDDIKSRIEKLEEYIQDEDIEKIKNKLPNIIDARKYHSDPEKIKYIMDGIQESKKLLSKVRKNNLKKIRQIELDSAISFFNDVLLEYAKASEKSRFDTLRQSAQKSIESDSRDFELYLENLRNLFFDILWKQDWFIIDRFRYFSENQCLFLDQLEYSNLVNMGESALRQDDIVQLRKIVIALYNIKIHVAEQDDIFEASNIIRG
jgi:molecular chaperone DnaK